MLLHYQWIPWSYSHAASLYFARKLWVSESATQWHDHFDVVRSQIDYTNYAVLPIENSYAWPIHTNVYNFLRYKHHSIDEYYQPINHCLIGHHTDLSKITDVRSHPQALAQCYEYCKKHGITQHEAGDTAGSVQELAKKNEPTHAAIGSSLSAELYGLEVIQEKIQDNSENTTRFLLVAPELQQWEKKTMLAFSIRNGQWVLYKCLGAFATHGIDLTKIESLPSRQDPFTYYFWVECDAVPSQEHMQEALKELEFFTTEIRILGVL